MSTTNLDRDQKNLLLYMETRCVDYDGILDDRQMNDADWANLERRVTINFVSHRFRRDTHVRGKNHVVRLLPIAWDVAHELRRERAGRASPEIWGDE